MPSAQRAPPAAKKSSVRVSQASRSSVAVCMRALRTAIDWRSSTGSSTGTTIRDCRRPPRNAVIDIRRPPLNMPANAPFGVFARSPLASLEKRDLRRPARLGASVCDASALADKVGDDCLGDDDSPWTTVWSSCNFSGGNMISWMEFFRSAGTLSTFSCSSSLSDSVSCSENVRTASSDIGARSRASKVGYGTARSSDRPYNARLTNGTKRC